ncbi:DUF4917 family protein [Acinetobacter johnsonii]|uniref:DUF4917 family protein n=1 Tax=Acinetobacter johnsonii TaxID=40214 RepID=UPI0030188CE5
MKIYKWGEIQNKFYGSQLILGNGSSIAIDSRFSYSSLLEHAKKHNHLNNDINELFNFFDTKDFELILRLVWQAAKVNKSLRIEDNKTYNAYINLRNALIQTVRAIHPSYEEVLHHLPIIHNFIRSFSVIHTLNYDLILYWAMMYGNDNDDVFMFKDCFIHGEFKENWRSLTGNYYGKSSILVFYPHGSLLLGRNVVENEIKIYRYGDGGILNTILDAWESEEVVPLFVSEGTPKQKVNAIKNSNYLNTIYREVLGRFSRKIVIYGWGFGEQDMHILQALKQHSMFYMSFAISVFGDDQAFCNRVEDLLRRNFYRCEVYFFDSQSSGCWNNPISEN